MKSLAVSVLLLLAFNIAFAFDLKVPLKENPEKEPPITEDNRHRMPGKQIMCTIDSEKGVYIEGVPTSEILSFDIYDESGELCFASYNNEEEFVGFLFSLEGEYVIRFVTSDKTYSGFISL
ncbi:MAG: hypothetical protein K2F70_01975 [Muribaculaceae bacterium]|nr:hypothetical protein [Muribaculaceae bacterium]